MWVPSWHSQALSKALMTSKSDTDLPKKEYRGVISPEMNSVNVYTLLKVTSCLHGSYIVGFK